MKTKEELNTLKEEVEALNKKLHELTDEELAKVAGGGVIYVNGQCLNMYCADYGKKFNRALMICPTCHSSLSLITE